MERDEMASVDFDAFQADVFPGNMPVKENPEAVNPRQSVPVSSRRRKKTKESMPLHKYILLYLHDLVFLLVAVMLIFLLCFRVVVVSGTSMNATLLDGDYLLLLSNVFYKDIQQGDIIVASKESFDNGAPIVKRVIATQGQWIDIDFTAGKVYVGDSLDSLQPVYEPYTLTPTTLFEGISFPLKVEENCVFVMGDNRNGSKDSRNPEIGQIDCREILGKVIFLFLPGTNDKEVQRDYSRIGVIS